LSLGILNSVVTLASFLVLLWTISGTLELRVAGVEIAIPGYMVWVANIYATIGSVATRLVGKSLVSINFDLQKYDADFRFRMIRIRENAESIALYNGEADEQERLKSSFANIWRTWWRLMKTQRRLTFFTSAYGQLAVVFPIVVAAPRYFSGQIQLGGLTQTGVAFGQVQGALSWFVSAYPSIAEWTASVDRLIGFGDALAEVKQMGNPSKLIEVVSLPAPDLKVEDLRLELPDGRVILEDVSLTISAGEQVLLSGPSGSGKTTLFRALAGIWPYGKGRIFVPEGRRVLFLPQKPYLPISSLREAVSYPDGPDEHGEESLRRALIDARLPHLVDRLAEEANWSLELSVGEQQRIGFARVLLHRPQWLFMDEATSALDEESEQALYALISERLPGSTRVSIAHRPMVARFHRRCLLLRPEKRSLEDAAIAPTAGLMGA
jgi:putative ATP-binding cassette transporter